LPDLSQENSWVANTLIDVCKKMVSTFGIDGFRMDTVKQVRNLNQGLLISLPGSKMVLGRLAKPSGSIYYRREF